MYKLSTSNCILKLLRFHCESRRIIIPRYSKCNGAKAPRSICSLPAQSSVLPPVLRLLLSTPVACRGPGRPVPDKDGGEVS